MGVDMSTTSLLRRTVVCGAAIGIAAGTLMTWAPAGASPRISEVKQPSAIEVVSHAVSVTSSTHKTLHLSLGAADFVSGGDPSGSPSSLNATVSTPNGHELHQWVFQLSAGSFTTNAATSSGSIDTGASQISPYGQVSLTFSPAGSKVTTLKCTGGSTLVTRRITVNATVLLKTGTAWGNVGSLSHVTHFGTNAILSRQFGDGDCPRPPTYQSCETNVEWSANQSPIMISGGWSLVHGKKRSLLVGRRLKFLSAPAEADRFDTVIAKAPVPDLKVSHGKPSLLVKTSGHGATGQARLTSSVAAAPHTLACNSAHHHQTVEQWSNVKYTNGSPALTFHEQIEGPITLPNLTNASVTRSTQIN
jgi:hypothetical protein